MPASGPLGAVPWRTDVVPFTRQPMRDFADPLCDVVVMMVAAQCAKTETIFNILNWHYRTRPKPALYIAPTEKLCRTLSRDRLDSMLRSNPDLWPLVDKRYSKPGSMERWINGARLGMAWAGSPVELVSHPCHTVLVDERGVMEAVASNTSDPVRDAKARTKNYKGSKVGVFSTPLDEDTCPTFAWWRQGTRMRWCWECPKCGHWFPPRLRDMRYESGSDYPEVRESARIVCPKCEHGIRDGDVYRWEENGSVSWLLGQRYIPHVVDDDGEITMADGLESLNRVRSYWVTGFCSPFVQIADIAEELTRAAREGTPADVQSATNQYAGELFVIAGERPPWKQVLERQCIAIDDVDVQLVTAGVDVQQDSLYYVVRGWGYLGASWKIAHGQLHGATEYDDVWLQLANVLGETFCGRHIARVLVDSGYQAAKVYEICRRKPTWSPSKGSDSGRPFWDATVDESPTGRPRKALKLWHFNADTWKQWLYGKIAADVAEPGGWWVPQGTDEEYCQQVVNEKCVTLANGRRRWLRTGNRRNHLLDCEVLCAVGAHLENVRALKPPVSPENQAPEAPKPRQRAPVDPRMARRTI